MYVLITIAALVLLRLLLDRKHPVEGSRSVGAAARAELGAWFLAGGVLIGIFAVIFVLALAFGPIPQVHEW
jgi:uncharacterized protein YqgC (DUF456 family)